MEETQSKLEAELEVKAALPEEDLVQYIKILKSQHARLQEQERTLGPQGFSETFVSLLATITIEQEAWQKKLAESHEALQIANREAADSYKILSAAKNLCFAASTPVPNLSKERQIEIQSAQQRLTEAE